MPEFLSDAWLAALDDAARRAPPAPGVAPFVVEQVVTDGAADGVRVYHLVFTTEGLHVVPGAAPDADVSFATDLDTAARLARGETNAQQALAAGRFRVRGNIDTLTRRAGGLRVLDDVFAGVRADTTYR